MTQPAPASLPAEDLAAIRAISDRLAQLMLDRNFEALAQLYTVDAVLMPPNNPLIQGREQIRTFMEAFPKVTRFSIGIDEIDGRDDLIYVRGSYSMTVHPDGAPSPVDDVGKFLEIRRRQPDGSFPFAVDMFSSDKE